MFSVGFWILLLLPLVFWIARLLWWKRQLSQRKERVPATLTLLRPAGESLRVKLQEFDEKLSDQLFFAIGIPIALAVVRGTLRNVSWQFDAALIAASLLTLILFARPVFRTMRTIRNHRLGFHGERACGEQLNQLMLQGCRVFHDVPMDPYGNLDHVIVAPTGVYAVETKTRRMRKMPNQQEDHVVAYDGKCLRFPFGTNTDYLAQAQQQANRLQTFLGSAVGEAVKVSPILALPGWFVRRSSPRGIPVINPKSARHIVLDRKKPRMDPMLLKRVAHQLDQRCRDVTV